MNDQARAAAEKIFAAAAELGTTRHEAVLVTRAVHAVKNGRSTDVALTDTDQHRRRKLAHVVGTVLWDPVVDATAVLTAVTERTNSAAPAARTTSALMCRNSGEGHERIRQPRHNKQQRQLVALADQQG